MKFSAKMIVFLVSSG